MWSLQWERVPRMGRSPVAVALHLLMTESAISVVIFILILQKTAKPVLVWVFFFIIIIIPVDCGLRFFILSIMQKPMERGVL